MHDILLYFIIFYDITHSSYIEIDLCSFIPIYCIMLLYAFCLIFIFTSWTDPTYASYATVLIQIETSRQSRRSI